MPESRISTLRAILQPWSVRITGVLLAFLGGYGAFSNQFPNLRMPKLGSLLPDSAGMSGARLPLWGWILALQAFALYALFEYVRRTIKPTEIQPGIQKSVADLHQATDVKVGQITKEVQNYSESLRKDSLDLQQLLYFAIQQSTEALLVHLLSIAPRAGGDDKSELNEEAHVQNSEFLNEVGRCLSGSQRYSDYRNILMNGEAESDRRLATLPQGQWEEHLNPIELRRYFISGFTRRIMVEYLERQLNELQENIRSARYRLVEKYETREKS